MVSSVLKRILRYLLWLLPALLLLLAGVLFWLATTSSGSRTVFNAVSKWTPVQI